MRYEWMPVWMNACIEWILSQYLSSIRLHWTNTTLVISNSGTYIQFLPDFTSVLLGAF